MGRLTEDNVKNYTNLFVVSFMLEVVNKTIDQMTGKCYHGYPVFLPNFKVSGSFKK